MPISDRLLKYFNRRKSDSTDKDHTRYRNDICNHWDLDYMSIEEIDQRLNEGDVVTTLPRSKKET
jgi:hypothetical protein